MNSSPSSSSILMPPTASGWPKWRFTVLLGFGYSFIFHLWIFLPRQEVVIITGLAATLWLVYELIQAARANYFINRWDLSFHAAVILDVFLEALLIPTHNGLGFYWCTLAFGLVVGGYHGFARRSLEGGEAA